jgi:hypothetical protein
LDKRKQEHENKRRVWRLAGKKTKAEESQQNNPNNPAKFGVLFSQGGNGGNAKNWVCCRRHELIIWFCIHKYSGGAKWAGEKS